MEKRKTVVLMQSNYLPWKGYFSLINIADEFIFYDDVQYTKNDWRNRNQLKTEQGLEWMSIPCGSRISRLVAEVEIADNSWKKKHWGKICSVYCKAKYFPDYKDFFEDFYMNNNMTNLSQINQYLIRHISQQYLGIQTNWTSSIEYSRSDKRGSDRVLEIVLAAGATRYVTGVAAKNYLRVTEFEEKGIEVLFFDYSGYREYPQLNLPFVHAVSIIDLLFNCGGSSRNYLETDIQVDPNQWTTPE